MKRNVFCAGCAIFLMGLIAACVVPAEDIEEPELYVVSYEFGKIPWYLNKSAIGIRFEEGVSPDEQAALVATEPILDPCLEWELLPRYDTYVVGVRPDTTAAAIWDTLDRLSAAAEVYYATPVIEHRPGFRAVVMNKFSVTIPLTTPEEQVLALNEENHVLVTKRWDLSVIERIEYSLMVTKASGLNALFMAMHYYESIDNVMGAGPDVLPLYPLEADPGEEGEEQDEGEGEGEGPCDWHGCAAGTLGGDSAPPAAGGHLLVLAALAALFAGGLTPHARKANRRIMECDYSV